jgi:hypothetical protein
MELERTCPACGATFCQPRERRGRPRRYCSPTCAHAAAQAQRREANASRRIYTEDNPPACAECACKLAAPGPRGGRPCLCCKNCRKENKSS